MWSNGVWWHISVQRHMVLQQHMLQHSSIGSTIHRCIRVHYAQHGQPDCRQLWRGLGWRAVPSSWLSGWLSSRRHSGPCCSIAAAAPPRLRASAQLASSWPCVSVIAMHAVGSRGALCVGLLTVCGDSQALISIVCILQLPQPCRVCMALVRAAVGCAVLLPHCCCG